MKILHLTRTPIALAPARFVDLINKYTKHTATLVQLSDMFLGMPFKIPVERDRIKSLELIKQADIVHVHGSFEHESGISFLLDLKKKIVIHYHGSPQRESSTTCQTDKKLLVSTPEMLPLFPNAIFFPNLIDETDSIYVLKEKRNDNLIKVCHHFSLHPKKKNTSEFYNLTKLNNNTHQFDFLDKCSLVDTLNKRSHYDAVFDHLQGYYGLVSTEAMAQGIMTINACSEYCFKQLDKCLGSRPPFYIVSKDNIEEKLANLDLNTTIKLGKQGQDFMKNHWSGKTLIQRLIKIYEEL